LSRQDIDRHDVLGQSAKRSRRLLKPPETNDFGIAALTYAEIKLVLLHKPTFAAVDGTTRKEIKKGMLVGIIQKHHQRTGEITEGFVQDILTRSSFHPHGIKVRLKSREVGRVQEIIDNMDD
jgi:uncharacterized repeat protein (TIGR03833 family)